jgi:hypothetical protein
MVLSCRLPRGTEKNHEKISVMIVPTKIAHALSRYKTKALLLQAACSLYRKNNEDQTNKELNCVL